MVSALTILLNKNNINMVCVVDQSLC